jgi:hypothetical protein
MWTSNTEQNIKDKEIIMNSSISGENSLPVNSLNNLNNRPLNSNPFLPSGIKYQGPNLFSLSNTNQLSVNSKFSFDKIDHIPISSFNRIKTSSIFIEGQESKQLTSGYKAKIIEVKLDMGNMQETSKNLFDDLQCPICLHLLVDPESCNKCCTLFCSKCLFESLKAQKKTCPLRCSNIKVHPANLPLKRILGKLKILCPQCGMHMLNEELTKHLTICENNIFVCSSKDCNFEGSKKIIQEHVKVCDYAESRCDACFSVFLRREKQVHIEYVCPESLIKCSYCEVKMKRKFEKFHSKEECFFVAMKNKDKVIEDLKDKLGKFQITN